MARRRRGGRWGDYGHLAFAGDALGGAGIEDVAGLRVVAGGGEAGVVEGDGASLRGDAPTLATDADVAAEGDEGAFDALLAESVKSLLGGVALGDAAEVEADAV